MQKTFLFAADIHGTTHTHGRLEEVLQQVHDCGYEPDTIVLGGDYVGTGRPPRYGRNDQWQPAFSLDHITHTIQSVFPSVNECLFTYGSHDKNEIHGITHFFRGGRVFDDCLLYGISFSEMAFMNDGQREADHYDGIDVCFGNAEQAIQDFHDFLNHHNDHRPLLVVSHMPLHVGRGDNLGASLWMKALNEAAIMHPVLFFYGHNHSYESHGHPEDRNNYFIQSGNIMHVQGYDKEDFITSKISFVYLNIGYILNGCATAITFDTSDHFTTMTIRRIGDSSFGTSGILSPICMQIDQETGNSSIIMNTRRES